MEPAFRGLDCVDCGERLGSETDARRCPDCEGPLAPRYDADAVDVDAIRDAWPATDQWAFESLLPQGRTEAVSIGEGATPLVPCPGLADELGVGRILVKDEGQNPTGTVADRELSAAISAAAARGATDVALPSTGTDAVAAAAYAARAGLDAHAFVPTRSTHGAKAMINVHGGDMTVVEGRLPDAIEAYESSAEADWTPVAAGDAPSRIAGAGTCLLEVLAALDWETPDAVVYPVGHGVGIVGADVVTDVLQEVGLLEEPVALCAAQAAGCAPIVEAVTDGLVHVSQWDAPDTIAGAIEVPDPALGDRALEAVESTDGAAVAVDDESILESACVLAASEGVQASVAGGAAAAGAWDLAQDGAFGADDTVVLVNTGAGSLDSDLLRSHLMRAGV